MSSPTPSVETTGAHLRSALLVAAHPATTLAALGACFDDIVVARLDRVRDDLGAAGDSVVVVDGPVTPEVTDAVAEHVMTHPGRRLALSVSRDVTALGGVEHAGLKIVGGGLLGELPVTWWTAADAGLVDPAELPGGSTVAAAGPSAVDPDAFGAHARILRADLELAEAQRLAGAAQEDVASSGPADSPVPEPPSAVPSNSAVVRVRLRRRYRLAIAGALVGVGVVGGVGLAQLDDDPVAATTLVATAAILLVLVWGVLVVRRLALRLEEQTARTRRLGREFERGLRQLTKRAQAGDARDARLRQTLREIEARLAVVSSATFNSGRVRATKPRTTADELDDLDDRPS